MSNPVFSESTFERVGYSSAQNSMTVNGSIMKTFILGLVFVMTSFVVYAYFPHILSSMDGNIRTIYIPMILATVIAVIIAIKPVTAPYLSMVYAVLESIFVTLLSIFMNNLYNGIVFEAVTYTMITFFTMLILFRLGVIKATAKFKSVVITATATIAISYIILFALSFFGIRPTWFYGSSTLSIVINAVVIVVAALNLILDFDFIVQGSESQMPKYMEWYAAFGLMVTIIWLYIEILRILAKLKDR